MPLIACNCGGYRGDFNCSEVEWESQPYRKNGPDQEPHVEWRGIYEVECPRCGKMISAVYVVWEYPQGRAESSRTEHFFSTVDGLCWPMGLGPQ